MASALSRDSSLDFLAETLERLLGSSPDEADGIYRWLLASSQMLHGDAIDVLVNVGHFVADFAVRSDDDDYLAVQAKAMRDLIAALRRGETREQLLMFSFLE